MTDKERLALILEIVLDVKDSDNNLERERALLRIQAIAQGSKDMGPLRAAS